jgi:hypothetical protein
LSFARRGIGLIRAATLAIFWMITCAMKGSPVHGPIERVFYRGAVALESIVPFMIFTLPPSVFKTKPALTHLYRAALGKIGRSSLFGPAR